MTAHSPWISSTPPAQSSKKRTGLPDHSASQLDHLAHPLIGQCHKPVQQAHISNAGVHRLNINTDRTDTGDRTGHQIAAAGMAEVDFRLARRIYQHWLATDLPLASLENTAWRAARPALWTQPDGVGHAPMCRPAGPLGTQSARRTAIRQHPASQPAEATAHYQNHSGRPFRHALRVTGKCSHSVASWFLPDFSKADCAIGLQKNRLILNQWVLFNARRYCTASATCVICTVLAPARSAMVRATFRQR